MNKISPIISIIINSIQKKYPCEFLYDIGLKAKAITPPAIDSNENVR